MKPAAEFPQEGPVTKREVAAYLRMSIDTVERYARDGRLPAPRCIGSAVRFEARQIRQLWQAAAGDIKRRGKS